MIPFRNRRLELSFTEAKTYGPTSIVESFHFVKNAIRHQSLKFKAAFMVSPAFQWLQIRQ